MKVWIALCGIDDDEVLGVYASEALAKAACAAYHDQLYTEFRTKHGLQDGQEYIKLNRLVHLSAPTELPLRWELVENPSDNNFRFQTADAGLIGMSYTVFETEVQME